MALPRFIEIDGRRYLWRDLVALRRAQATPAEPQPTLFTLHEDHRPASERTARRTLLRAQPVHRAGAEPLRRFSLSCPLFDAPQAVEILPGRPSSRPPPPGAERSGARRRLRR